MFISFFKSRYFIQFVGLFFLAAILWIDVIIEPSKLVIDGNCKGFFGLTGFLQTFPIVVLVLSILLMLLQAVMLNQILENHRLMDRNQLLTAAIYILILCSSPVLSTPITWLSINFILILVLNIALNIYGKKQAYREVFDATFLLGIASLIHPPIIAFILFIWACLVLYQIFTWREWLISIIGISIPHLFAGTWYYLLGQLEEKINSLTEFFTQIQVPVLTASIYLYMAWGLIAVLVLLSLGQIAKRLSENTISLRKKFKAIVIFFVISLGSAVFSGNMLMLHLITAAIPTSVFIAFYLSKTKKRLIPEIVIFLLFAIIILGKYFNLG